MTHLLQNPEVIAVAQDARRVQQPEPAVAAWLTVERGIFALLVGVALFVRLWQVGQSPLHPNEANNVWPAWLAAQAVSAPNPPAPTSALLYALHTLLFWLTGGNDASARLIPALAGASLTLAAWWLRPWLGRTVALLAALLLAIDPWLTAVSRLADGAALSLLLGLLTLIGLWQIRQASRPLPERQRWLNRTALAAGLLAASGPLAWSFAPILVAAWLLPLGSSGPAASTDEADAEATALKATAPELTNTGDLSWRTPALVFVAALGLSATGWLAHPEGIGLISTSLSVWLGHFQSPAVDVYPLSWFWLRLLADQLPLVSLGLVGFGQLWWRRGEEASPSAGALRWLLTIWLAWGVVLALLPGRNPLVLPLVGLPLLLAAAYALERIVRQPIASPLWRETTVLVGVLTVLLVAALFWAWALIAQQQFDLGLARGAALFFLLAVVMVVLFALWANWLEARRVVGYYSLGILLLVALSNLWHLNQRVDPEQPDGFFAVVTNPDVRRLADAVQTLSAQRTGDATAMPIAVQFLTSPDPVIGWYLRKMNKLSWVLAPPGANPGAAQPPLVITWAGPDNAGDTPQLADYMGSQYTIRTRWLPSQLVNVGAPVVVPENADWQTRMDSQWITRWRPLLRWLAYREVRLALESDQVILWVNSTE